MQLFVVIITIHIPILFFFFFSLLWLLLLLLLHSWCMCDKRRLREWEWMSFIHSNKERAFHAVAHPIPFDTWKIWFYIITKEMYFACGFFIGPGCVVVVVCARDSDDDAIEQNNMVKWSENKSVHVLTQQYNYVYQALSITQNNAPNFNSTCTCTHAPLDI